MRSLVQRAVPVLATVASVGLLSTALQASDASSELAPAQSAAQALPAAADVPTPEDFFGFAMGATGQLADFPAVKEYMSLVADESDRVTYDVVDTTTMGNEYPLVFVSSPDNLERLDDIVAQNKQLASGALSDDEAQAVAAESVPVVMLEATLHSTEVSSTQALVDVVHRFASEDSAYAEQVLQNTVLMVIPSSNPDGQHLVVDYFQETAGTDYERVYPDLYHRYVGHDNNRDWITFSQRESKTRNRLEREYRPVMTHFLHQQGNTGERIFLPPYAQPISDNVSSLAFQSANTVGAAMARQLSSEGKAGIRTDAQRYGIFWNADVAGYSSFVGSSLLLTEIASAVDLAYPQESDDGTPLGPQERDTGFLDPYPDDTWTLEQMVDYATSAVYTGVEFVADDPQGWLYNNLHQVNRDNRQAEDRPYAYVFPAEQRDPFAVYELLSILDFGEVEIHRASDEFTAGDTTYAAGSHVVRTAQPVGAWVHQLLEVDEYPENSRRCEDCPLVLPYSETSDNLGMLFGVGVEAVAEEFEAELEPLESVQPTPTEMPDDPGERGAYLVTPDSYGVVQFVSALQREQVPTFRSAADFDAGDQSFPAGTVVVPATDTSRTALEEVSAQTGLRVNSTAQVPQVEGFQLAGDTRIGLVRGINNMPGGWMEWMFTEWGVDYEVVEADHYADGGLGERYDTIVLADGVTEADIVEGIDPDDYPERFSWARGVGESGWTELRNFVEQGGNLVAIGRSTQTATDLLGLPLEEATGDRAAAAAARHEGGDQPGNPRASLLPVPEPDPAAEETTIPGALLRVDYDRTEPVAWGMPESWPTWFNRDTAYRLSDDAAANVASRYDADDDLLVSGYAAGADGLQGLPHAMSFDVGEGQATVASSQVTFRSWTRATLPLVTNAIYHGPSEAVDTPEFGATFEQLLARIDTYEQDGTIDDDAAATLRGIGAQAREHAEAGRTERAIAQLRLFEGRLRALVDDDDARAELSELVADLIDAVQSGDM